MNIQHPLPFIFGILGIIFSFMVFLAPLPTFYGVYKKKTTEEYQSLPYVIALLSAMLWICYASLKPDAFLLITVNSIGCILEILYIIIYVVYAPKRLRILTAKLLVLLNFGLYSLIFLLSFFLFKGSDRVQFLGWVCDVFSVGVFAAPLITMRLVIRTKSVQFMPFSLSLFLTLSAITWFCYGVLLKDLHVALPNILGLILGVLQMVLYALYKDSNKSKEKEKEKEKQQEHNMGAGVKLSTMGCSDVYPFQIDAESIHVEVNDVDDDHQNKPIDDHIHTIEISTPTELPTLIECQA